MARNDVALRLPRQNRLPLSARFDNKCNNDITTPHRVSARKKPACLCAESAWFASRRRRTTRHAWRQCGSVAGGRLGLRLRISRENNAWHGARQARTLPAAYAHLHALRRRTSRASKSAPNSAALRSLMKIM